MPTVRGNTMTAVRLVKTGDVTRTPENQEKSRVRVLHKTTVTKKRKVQREDRAADDDDDVVEVQTLSCEDIVNRKFKSAAANGYVISID